MRRNCCATALGINDVTTAINANSANAGGGRVARGQQSYVVRGVGLVRNLDDLGNIVVAARGTMPILVRDLGTLTYTHQEREGILGKDENPDTIEGIVQMLKYQNASQVIKDLHAKLAELQAATRCRWTCTSSPISTARISCRRPSTRSPTRCSKASASSASC